MKKRILLVEDDASIVKVTRARLEHEGYEVVVATDGEEALKQVRTNDRIDLILLDLKLPKLDGFQVCKRLKESPASGKIPIIVFTASSVTWEKLRDQCIELGVSDWLMKPFGSQELLDKVRQVLGGGG